MTNAPNRYKNYAAYSKGFGACGGRGMIPGWDGPTRVVEGVGECPETRFISRGEENPSHDYIVRITKRDIVAREELPWFASVGRTEFHYSRKGIGRCRGIPCINIHPDDLAALRAFAAQHGGVWRAGEDGGAK